MSDDDSKSNVYTLSRRELHEEMSRIAGESGLVLRNVVIGGKRTSLRLEPLMWDALNEICEREGLSLNEICTLVDQRRMQSSFTASIRVFTLAYFRAAAQEVDRLKQKP